MRSRTIQLKSVTAFIDTGPDTRNCPSQPRRMKVFSVSYPYLFRDFIESYLIVMENCVLFFVYSSIAIYITVEVERERSKTPSVSGKSECNACVHVVCCNCCIGERLVLG